MSSLEQGHHHPLLKLPPQLSLINNSTSNNTPQQGSSYHHHQHIQNNNNTNTPNNNIHLSNMNNTNITNNNNTSNNSNNNNLMNNNQNLYQKASQSMMNNIHPQQQQMIHAPVSNKVNNNLDNERLFQSYDELNSQQQYPSFDFHNANNVGGMKASNSNPNNNPNSFHQKQQQSFNQLMASPTRMNPSQVMNQKGPNTGANNMSSNMMLNNVNNNSSNNSNNGNNNYQSATMDKSIPNGSMQHSHSPDTQFFNQGTFSPQKQSQQQQQLNMDNFKINQNQMFYNQTPQNNPSQQLFQPKQQVPLGDFASHMSNNNIPNQSNSPQPNVNKESLYQSFPTALHQYNYNAQAQQSKSTAAPVVEVISNLFKGFEFCLSGKFTLIQRKFETLILQHGGSVQKSINAVVTHLISTQDELQQEEKAVKVTKAIARNIPIITEDFIQDSIKQNNLQDVKNYVLPTPKDQKKDSKTSSVEQNQPSEPQENDKKRKADDTFHFDAEDIKRLKQFEFVQSMNKNH